MEDENVKLYELIPDKEIVARELKPFINRAIYQYIQFKVKEVTSQYMREVITREEFDIKEEEHVLTMKGGDQKYDENSQ
jgi:hypothetical protein